MHEGLNRLSDREKQTLRMLLGGHDAKSIARVLDISVHTVNERLRESRRKLGVTSSREAARVLSQAEQQSPHFHADNGLGGAQAAMGADVAHHSGTGRIARDPLIWLLGGIFVMSLILAALMLSPWLDIARPAQVDPTAIAAMTPNAEQAALAEDARRWLATMDGFRWEESWRKASAYFRSQVSAAQWAAQAEPVRHPLGPVTSRVLKSVETGGSKQAVAFVKFRTRFTIPDNAIETVVLMREKEGWLVAGYTILPDTGQ